ncbi:class I SAM-dependent methyltransferase [Kibdelosporangium aridum]|nr:class I SAM-dependent methyltransferase [Kibdelosporangium aridum]
MATPGAVPFDYDSNPDRYRMGSKLSNDHSRINLYARVAARLTGADLVLDVGCAEGVLCEAMPDKRLIGLDMSMPFLRNHPAPRIQANATAIPFRDNTFDGVTAVNMLYHLTDPRPALKEAKRVLKPGGVMIAATIARTDSPEFAGYRTRPPTTFDAEEAPEIVRDVFGEVEVDAWDAPLLTLPTKASIRDYLLVRRVSREAADKAAQELDVPLSVTKRGAMANRSKACLT